MNGLAGVLAGHHSVGVFTWATDFAVEDVRDSVEHAGWHFGHVDGRVGGTKAEFLTAVGVALDFPSHYGRNLDALADCLADLTEDTVLLWDCWSPLAGHDEKAFRIVLEVLRERAADDRAARLVVLLRGDGPEVEVPPLD